MFAIALRLAVSLLHLPVVSLHRVLLILFGRMDIFVDPPTLELVLVALARPTELMSIRQHFLLAAADRS